MSPSSPQPTRPLDLLPAGYQQALELADRGLNAEAVAVSLGIEPRAGALLLSVARQKLQALLDGTADTEADGRPQGRTR